MADQPTPEAPETPEVTIATTVAPTPSAPAPAPARPEPIAVTAEQLARWRQIEADNAKMLAAEELRQREAQEAEEKRLMEQGQLKEVIANKERLIAERDKKARETDARFRRTTLESQLAFALADHPLTKGSPDQLLRLLRDDLEVVEDGESWKVQSRDGRAVKQYVAETLAHEDFAKYVRAATAGGGPPSKGGASPPIKPPERPDPEKRQVDSLKASVSKMPANRLAGVPSNN